MLTKSLTVIALVIATNAYAQSPGCNPYVSGGGTPCNFTPTPTAQLPAGATGWLQPYPGLPPTWVTPYDTQQIDELSLDNYPERACTWLVLVNDDPTRAQTVNLIVKFQSDSGITPMQFYIGLLPNERKELAEVVKQLPRNVYFSITAYLAASGSMHATQSNCVNAPTMVSAHQQR